MTSVPSHARVVIIGGGIVGCSVAYHLALRGCSDVLLLERRQLTCGTTWHAAGLVGQLRATHNLTRLAQYTTELYEGLERETGQATGFRQVGSIAVAASAARFEELRRGASMARVFGLEVQILSPGEAKERWPLLSIEGVVGGVYLPRDGRCNPVDTTQALARGARMRGVRILEQVKVTGIRTEQGRVTGVTTEAGEVRADVVVNCAGMWAREVGALAQTQRTAARRRALLHRDRADPGTARPICRSCATPTRARTSRRTPASSSSAGSSRLPSRGARRAFPTAVPSSSCPPTSRTSSRCSRAPCGACRRSSRPAYRCSSTARRASRPMTAICSARRRRCAACTWRRASIPSAFSPRAVPARCSPTGSSTGIRRSISGTSTSAAVRPFQRNRRYLRDRTVETLGLLYAMHWPFRQAESARGVRRSVLHERLKSAGACFGEVAGYERANWFATDGSAPRYEYSYGRQNWFAQSAAEHRAVREGVGLFDQSSFAKFTLRGRDAARVLGRICANDVEVAVGRVVYTQWLNERGGIEADLTVTREAEDSWLIVSSCATQTRDFAWLCRSIPQDAHAVAVDVSSAYAVLGLMGPESRESASSCCNMFISVPLPAAPVPVGRGSAATDRDGAPGSNAPLHVAARRGPAGGRPTPAPPAPRGPAIERAWYNARVFEQPLGKTFLRQCLGRANDAGQEPHAGVDQRNRRRLAARQGRNRRGSIPRPSGLRARARPPPRSVRRSGRTPAPAASSRTRPWQAAGRAATSGSTAPTRRRRRSRCRAHPGRITIPGPPPNGASSTERCLSRA